jgi:hypothetical protein
MHLQATGWTGTVATASTLKMFRALYGFSEIIGVILD